MKKVSAIISIGLVCFLTAFMFLIPNLDWIDHKEMICADADGNLRRITYAEAYEKLQGVDRAGIYLTDGGFVEGSKTFQTVVGTLEGGDSVHILAINSDGLTDFERIAIYRAWRDTLFYDGVPYVWNGHEAERTDDIRAEKVVLSHGDFPKGFLAETGAKELRVLGTASLTASGLVGSRISSLSAEEPYVAEGDCLYLEHRGRRLIAALPKEELTIGEADYYDDGALDACAALSSLTLFRMRGELRSLFSEGVPASLKRVTVSGGRIPDLAFYACPDVTEIFACGVSAQTGAFIGCSSLQTLHIATENVLPDGEYSKSRAECGCFIFTKMG